MYAKKNSGKKIAAVLLAVALLIGGTIGGTLAWLKDSTGTVTNTFTVGDIDIELKEHDLKTDGTLDNTTTGEVTSEDTYKIVPGDTQPKDPFVRFVDDSEPCWLFVKIEEKNNTITDKTYKYVTYTVNSDWTALDPTKYPGVYYMELNSLTAANTKYDILANNQVSYSSDLTKADLDAVGENKPQLVFTAYAVQKEAATTAETAWTAATTNP